MTYLSQAVLAFFCTALLIMMMRRPAERFGLVDHPGGRKRHAGVVPLTGGVAMVAGFMLALAVTRLESALRGVVEHYAARP